MASLFIVLKRWVLQCTAMTCKNDRCPITFEFLADIAAGKIFVHEDIGMEVDALYCYLLKAPDMLNPVTRAPFQIHDLLRLEETFLGLHGPGSICDLSSDTTTTTHDMEMTMLHEESVITNVTVTMVENNTEQHTLRLQVDLDVPDTLIDATPAEPIIPALPSDLPVCATDSSDMVLPVKSLVKEFLDAGRSVRFRNDLNTISFLCFEATEVCNEMIALMMDTMWHQQVWQQTSRNVIEAVTELYTPPNGPDTAESLEEYDLNLEVEYTDCWEVYRLMILHVLEKRYTQLLQRLAELDREECRLLVKINRDMVTRTQSGDATDILHQILVSAYTSVVRDATTIGSPSI